MQATPKLNTTRTQARDLWSLGVLPVMVFGALAGSFGVNWDISWHIDIGRDTFFTMPHNFIYASMLVVLLTSLYGLVRDQRDTKAHLRFGQLRLHPGLLVGSISTFLILVFAPADELWHQFFGVDATLWGPMHLIGLTGFSLFVFAAIVTSVVEREISTDGNRKTLFSLLTVFFSGILLTWMVLFLAEYEFNVAQFPVLLHPLLLAGLTTLPLVLAARLNPQPWAATTATVVFTLIRLALMAWLTVTSGMDLAGNSKPVIPVLILSGLAADLLVRRGTPAWLTGLLVGATTLIVNYFVTAANYMLPWSGSALALGVPAGLALAVLAAILAWRIGDALEPKAVKA